MTETNAVYQRRHDATRTISMKMAVRLLAAKTIANMMQRDGRQAS